MDEAVDIITHGGVAIIPTDTLYGIVASAFDPDAIDRIYDLKQRNPDKPLIVLISDIAQLEQFGVVVSSELEGRLHAYWPGAYSIILPVIDEQFEYIHRGTNGIAFRYPDSQELLDFISQTGPIVAPSANPENMRPARNATEARVYFGTDVDCYVEGDDLSGKASTIISFDGDEVITERE
jgi:L-threonylcarbamoyladenylate synthase